MTFTLPPVGSSVEKNRIDCKATYAEGEKRAFEMGKDVAAFANANGGTLLIGSVEQGGILKAHVGLDAMVAQQLRRAIEESVRNFVRPTPVIDFPEPVAMEGGKVILVVEIQPFPGQAVGVHVGGQKEEHPWVFPVRVGTQTVWYSPEQLVLLMDVSHRRKVQLLTQCSGHDVIFHHSVEPDLELIGGEEKLAFSGKLVELDEQGNSVCIEARGHSVWVSMDDVERVWRTGEKWNLRMNGYLYADSMVLRLYDA